jgi:glycosyltransferase involved in cell wall biosynthesis
MQKKLLIFGPIFSASGYGKMARFALEALSEHPDKFDIYINNTTWGLTGNIFDDASKVDYINHLRDKTSQYLADGGKFDISLQITIPNEWKRMAPVNIGFTAGIEADVLSHVWYEPCRVVDKIITTSKFTKEVFQNTIFGGHGGLNVKIDTTVESMSFPYETLTPAKSNFDFKSDFNFLTVNQWGIRKNMELLISSFIDEFRDENVGLVIKTNTVSDCQIDKYNTERQLQQLIMQKGPKKCQVYLIHGRMTDEEMAGLYRHNKIKSFVTSTHGEGFGFPIFEATQAELPVIATDWSSHLEFLTIEEDKKVKKMFGKVDFVLDRVPQNAVWPGVLEAHARWAYVSPASLRNRMREVYKDYGRFKSWAKKLAIHNKDKYDADKVKEDFVKKVNYLWHNLENIENDMIFEVV